MDTIVLRRINNEFYGKHEKKSIGNILSIKTYIDGPVIKYNVKFELKSVVMDCVLNKNYPFSHPEKVYINNKSYTGYFETNEEIKEYFLKYRNIICLCCDTLTCPNMWSPTNYLTDIVNEYIDRNNIVLTFNGIYELKKHIKLPNEIFVKIRKYLLVY